MRDNDVVIRFNHPNRDPGFTGRIIIFLLQRRIHLPPGNQPGAECKHVHGVFFQVFLRRHRVAHVRLHAAVPVHCQRIHVRPGTLVLFPFLRALSGFGGQHFPVSDHHAVEVIFRLLLADLYDPQAVHIIRHGQYGRMQRHQFVRVVLAFPGCRCAAVSGIGLRHNRAHLCFRGAPDFRHTVFPDLFAAFFRLLPGPGHRDCQVLGGILPDAVLFILQDVFLRRVILASQKTFIVKMIAVLLRLRRRNTAHKRKNQDQDQDPRDASAHCFVFFRM